MGKFFAFESREVDCGDGKEGGRAKRERREEKKREKKRREERRQSGRAEDRGGNVHPPAKREEYFSI